MRKSSFVLALAAFLAVSGAYAQSGSVAIVIHAGAGTIKKENLTEAQEAAYREKLREAVQTGHQVLAGGGSSLDAVTTAITVMEDSPLFNAGKGAVFTHEGHNELDASIMEGRNLSAGSVAGVRHVRSPIRLARAVMEKSRHVLLAGGGAEAFAREQGFEPVAPSYFHTERRWRQLQEAKESGDYGTSPDQPDSSRGGDESAAAREAPGDFLFSTVGAVALDRNGDIVAGTSTGGQTNKRYGRIGDSPIIGAGTYADNRTGGFSATGHGETFQRLLATHDIHALMAYRGLSLREAMTEVVMNKLAAMDAGGGIIGLDKDGNVAAVFNTAGMYRAWIDRSGDMTIRMYGEE